MSAAVIEAYDGGGEESVRPVETDLIATLGPMNLRQKLGIAVMAIICLWGLVAYIHQCMIGLSATAMTNYFSWGVYIINFVFFIGISHAGMLVSAILRASGAGWRRPITRAAEAMTVFALLVGSVMIVIDMGRPDRLLNLIIHGRLQSPILWDVLSVTTYFCGSVMYLYLPLIPDLAVLRDHPTEFPAWRRKLYSVMSLGWQNTPQQQRALHRAISVIAVVIIPVAISVHTVVSWIFAMTLRVGWHSTIFGPYFVVGAIYSGIAALLIAMAVFNWYFRDQHLDRYITFDHFKKLSLLLLAVTLVYIYFTLSEYLTMGYTAATADKKLLDSLFYGQYALLFWLMAVFGLFVPAILLSLPWTRNIKGIVTACILINIGMWLKRYVIIVPTLASPYLPAVVRHGHPISYSPTWVEWSITAAGFSAFCLMYLLFAKLFPIVSIWEVECGQREERQKAIQVLEQSHQRHALVGVRSVLVPVLLAVAVFTGTAHRVSAQAASQPAATLKLEVVTLEGHKLVQAKLLHGDKPVQDAVVRFSVQRTFGKLQLGDVPTMDNGTAAVSYPSAVPGNSAGEITLIAQVQAPASMAGVQSQLIDRGAMPARSQADPFPRALWAPHAPIQFLAVILTLFGGFWAAYLFVIWQFIAIKRGGAMALEEN